jgi:hypothetical protein
VFWVVKQLLSGRILILPSPPTWSACFQTLTLHQSVVTSVPASVPKKPKRKSKGGKKQSLKTQWPKPVVVSFCSKGAIGFPDALRIIVKVTQTANAMGGSATPAGVAIRCNSAFDPFGGGGPQPPDFANLVTVYNKYCVLGCKAVIEWQNPNTTESANVVGVFSDTDTSSTIFDYLCNAKYCKKGSISFSPGPNRLTMTMPFMTTAHITGRKDIEEDSNLYALTTTNPVDFWYLVLKAKSVDGSTTINVEFAVTLYMEVLFRELVQP